MEYRITLPPRTPVDLDRLAAALQGFDPAAIVDHDAVIGRLRINAAMSSLALAGLLHALGVPVTPDGVETQPSVCCGGCG
ncbi:hypothetical protein, partial [Arenimonas composti]